MKKSFWLLLLAACMTALTAAPLQADGVHSGGVAAALSEPERMARPVATPPDEAEFAQPDDQYDSLYDDAGDITPAFKRQEALYKAGDIRGAYAGWLQLAWKGDMFAMGALAAISRAHAGQAWPVPPEFWENWLLALLGKGEGGYVLGVQYAMLTGQREPTAKSGEFFLKSARTGHWAGMYGAFATARERETASRMGYEAVKVLAEGEGNQIIGILDGYLRDIEMEEALAMTKKFQMDRYQILEALTNSCGPDF